MALGLPNRKFRNLSQYLRYVATGLNREADFIEGEKMKFENKEELYEVLDPYIQQLMIATEMDVQMPLHPRAGELEQHIKDGQKIKAIKALREIFKPHPDASSKLGLKDAKDEVERVAEFNYDTSAGRSSGYYLVDEWIFKGHRFK